MGYGVCQEVNASAFDSDYSSCSNLQVNHSDSFYERTKTNKKRPFWLTNFRQSLAQTLSCISPTNTTSHVDPFFWTFHYSLSWRCCCCCLPTYAYFSIRSFVRFPCCGWDHFSTSKKNLKIPNTFFYSKKSPFEWHLIQRNARLRKTVAHDIQQIVRP